jgi:hypothetical protein
VPSGEYATGSSGGLPPACFPAAGGTQSHALASTTTTTGNTSTTDSFDILPEEPPPMFSDNTYHPLRAPCAGQSAVKISRTSRAA